MIVLPPGRFRMGDLAGNIVATPAHEVRIDYTLAVGKYEVRFKEWDTCVSEGRCGGHRPGDEGWGRGDHPAINLNWYNGKSVV